MTALTSVALAMGVQPASAAISRTAAPAGDSNPGAFAAAIGKSFDDAIGDSFFKLADPSYFDAATATIMKDFPNNPDAAAKAADIFQKIGTDPFESAVGDTFHKAAQTSFSGAGPFSLTDLKSKSFSNWIKASFDKGYARSFHKAAQQVFTSEAPTALKQAGLTYDKHFVDDLNAALGSSIDDDADAAFIPVADEAFDATVGDGFVKLAPPTFAAEVGTSFVDTAGATFDKTLGSTFHKLYGAKVATKAEQIADADVGSSFVDATDGKARDLGATAVSDGMEGVAQSLGDTPSSTAGKTFLKNTGSDFAKESSGAFDNLAVQAFDSVAPDVMDQLGLSDQTDTVEAAFAQNATGTFDKAVGATFLKNTGRAYGDISLMSFDDVIADAGE